jgi:hypothetical protein
MRLLTSAILLLATSLPASALNSWGTDMSDLWWNPDESGWGINLAHQNDAIFATIFVYGPDNRTRWYVAPAMVAPAVTGTIGTPTYNFSGKLYETQGPALGTTFNPASVTNREVGTASINFYEVGKGILTYAVDSQLVTKEIRRQTFRQADIVGSYYGAVSGQSCSGGWSLGLSGDINIQASGNTVAIQLPNIPGTGVCTYTGIQSQEGRMGSVTGTYSCTGGATGRFTFFEIEAGYGSISFRVDNNSPCGATVVAGARRR